MIQNASYASHRAPRDAQKQILFVVIGVFLIVAPLSVGGFVAEGSWLKWGRVGILATCLIASVRWLYLPSYNTAAGKLLYLAIVFCLAALWSSSPFWGLLYKGMFVGAVLAGFALSNALTSELDFRSFARALTSAA